MSEINKNKPKLCIQNPKSRVWYWIEGKINLITQERKAEDGSHKDKNIGIFILRIYIDGYFDIKYQRT